MGYTHYWRGKNASEISPEAWAKIKADAQKLIAKSDAPLCLEDDSEEPPELTDDEIVFNGQGVDGHETFWLTCKLKDFEFCKTAAKPYDKVVVAILAVAAEHAPDAIAVSSDGGPEDWEGPLTWASSVLGRQILYPVHNKDEVD